MGFDSFANRAMAAQVLLVLLVLAQGVHTNDSVFLQISRPFTSATMVNHNPSTIME
jgi:hypothetical protein